MPTKANAPRAPSPLEGVLDHLRGEPSRTWSIVITIFGDAVVPRGGSIWLGSLLEIFDAMGIGAGVVRTAMSRLAADDWLVRSRVGRNSFYALTGKGRSSFAEAERRIYGKLPAEWDGQFRLLIAGREPNRDTAGRAALEALGFGHVTPGVWIAPPGVPILGVPILGVPVLKEAEGFLQMTAQADQVTGRRMAVQAWPLMQTAEAYARFLAVFEPLQSWTRGPGLSDRDAMVARILLVHEYRRINLRDPLLPGALLPEDWPGTAARRLCAAVYHALLPRSERWLDQHGLDEHGPLRPPIVDLHARFEPP